MRMLQCAGLSVLLLIVLMVGAGLIGCHSGGGKGADVTGGVSPWQEDLRGDLNGNGQPDITDAIGILRVVVGLDPANALADCDCDSATGVTDAIVLLRCIVGLRAWPIVCGGDPVLGDEKLGPDGQTLVWVPGGSFMMGCDEFYGTEQPVHRVTLDGFWLGKCEITNAQYATFLNVVQPGSIAPWLDLGGGACQIERIGGVYQPIAVWAQYPVVAVSWEGARVYCEHYGYSLPTEAQWEYGAAGPDAHKYPWGTEWDGSKLCYWDNTGPYGEAFPVGSLPAGASWCGARDMAGNVWEWCSDWYSGTYYATSPEQNPTGPAEGTYKILRGGSWYFSAVDDHRCQMRYMGQTFMMNGRFGFRCVMPQ